MTAPILLSPSSSWMAELDLNREYAAHQRCLMAADRSASPAERRARLDEAHAIAARIGAFQRRLGAAAACAWSMAQVRPAA